MEDDAYLYALEKYAVAIHELVGAADIRARLHDACLSILPLSPRQLPEHVRDKHEALKDALTWVPVEEPGEGQLLSTLRVMDDTEADRLAKTFFEVYMDINDASHDARQP